MFAWDDPNMRANILDALKVRKRGHTPRKTKVRFEEDVTWDVQLRPR